MKKRIIALSTTAALLSSIFVTPAFASTYTVKKGDTLAKIAQKYDTTIDELIKLNDLESDMILVNQKLMTSASTAKKAGQEDAAVTKKTYKVVAGDTLVKIANKHDITLAELKELNPKLSSKIYVGQEITVPETENNSTGSTEKTAKITSDTYVVVSGDTLSKIAKNAGVTVADLKSINNLKSDTINIGQKLKIGKAVKGTIVTTSASIKPANETATVGNIDTVISVANSVLGTPYLWAGTTPAGFDCSGFVYYAFNQAGFDITRHSAASFYTLGEKVTKPRKGDLVYFAIGSDKTKINHMGIYLGDNQFIHASSSKGVMINDVTSNYYSSNLVGYNRFN